MNILVTGADGFLGSNITRELLSRQYQVTAFISSDSVSTTLDGLPVDRFTGNILNPKDVEQAMDGCDAVIHAAASTSIWPSRSERVRAINMDGTDHMIRAALNRGCQRFLYIGSAGSFGFGTKIDPGDESRPFRGRKYGLDYIESKLEAQHRVLRAVAQHDLPAIVLNPTFMIGPYDSKPSSGAMIRAIYEQKLPGYSRGGRNYIYVKDAAKAIANALTMGRIRQCYILGHENMNYREAFTRMAQVIGVPAPRLPIPSWASQVYGAFGSLYGALTQLPPTVTYTMARMSNDRHYYTGQKAVEELAMPQTNLDIAIRESFLWMKEQGMLTPKATVRRMPRLSRAAVVTRRNRYGK